MTDDKLVVNGDKIIEGTYTVAPISGGEEMPGFQYRWMKELSKPTGQHEHARIKALNHAEKFKRTGMGVRIYHEVTYLVEEAEEPALTVKDLIEQLEKLANTAETAVYGTEEMRLMPAAGVADILYDVIEVLEDIDE